VLSRAAESIFWMSRYVERAENVARFIHVNLQLELDVAEMLGEQWDPLVKVTGDDRDFHERYGRPTRENVIEFLTFDRENPNSILSCVDRARENARSVREIISTEMWEEINRFYLDVHAPGAREQAAQESHDFFLNIRRASHLIEGTKNETMSRGEAWHFSRLGRYLERADKTTRILDVKYYLLLPSVGDVGKPLDDVQWTAVLQSASAFQVYRTQYGQIDSLRVAELLLLDRDFPRSVHHCVSYADASLHSISGAPRRGFHNSAERALGKLAAELDYTDVEEVVEGGLHEFLDGLQGKLNDAGAAIFDTFVALKPVG